MKLDGVPWLGNMAIAVRFQDYMKVIEKKKNLPIIFLIGGQDFLEIIVIIVGFFSQRDLSIAMALITSITINANFCKIFGKWVKVFKQIRNIFNS